MTYRYEITNDEASDVFEVLAPAQDRIPVRENYFFELTPFEKRTTLIAYDDNTPVGFMQFEISKVSKRVKFHSLFVVPPHRHKGIASTLFKMAMEEALKRRGKIFAAYYRKEEPSTPYFEKILKKWNWLGPNIFMKRCEFDPCTFNAYWIHQRHPYPEHFEKFFWKDLKEEDRKIIQKKVESGIVPPMLSPFRIESKIEHMNSLGLYYKGEVVGWMITHRLDANTIRYSSLYIDPQFQRRGVAIILLVDSIHLHIKAWTKSAMLEIPYPAVHADWIHFVNKRLVPHAVRVTHILESWYTVPLISS